jgi:hypothetical protein
MKKTKVLLISFVLAVFVTCATYQTRGIGISPSGYGWPLPWIAEVYAPGEPQPWSSNVYVWGNFIIDVVFWTILIAIGLLLLNALL